MRLGLVIDACGIETFIVKDSTRKDRNIQKVLSLLQRIVILA